MAHFLPPEHVRQVNKLEWPNIPQARDPGRRVGSVNYYRMMIAVSQTNKGWNVNRTEEYYKLP